MFRILIPLLFLCQFASAQKLKKADKEIVQYLQQQVGYLSSDELKGRRAGDPGEILASNFIASKFKEIGLTPKGDNATYFQHFTINDGKEISQGNELKLNGKALKAGIDFFPLSNSPAASINAESSPSLNEKGQPWMLDLAEAIQENKENPHFDVANLLTEKMLKAKEKGASAVIFFNSSSLEDKIKFDPKDRSEPAPLPAAYINSNAQKQYLTDVSSSYQISANLSITPKIRKARNVIGYLDNQAQYTIVIGAHFDHLGFGEDGNSMIRTGDLGIHNGADDNASGTSSMIELAFLLKNSKSKQYNYLFIAFSAEELGLNGSKYFVENPTISLNSVNYMINMDMVGRMNDSTKTITVGGYGTSPSWKPMIDAVKKKDFSIRIDSSGTGPSDHTSFYRKDIPVLFFFTGLHSDYHKPSDDADKINYVGMLKIIRFIQQMIEADKQEQKLVFTKTREQQTSTSARFSVSMGIMPDYSYTGSGVRVDGVSDNRPAKKAGILTGDIVKQLGEHKTSSVESYMQALSKFKKGDKTTTIVVRGDKEISFEIVFLMKLRLDDDKMSDNFFEDTRILGIACTLKNYHFCWHIEKVLQIDFQTAPDLQIGMEKNRRSYSFTVYEFLHPISAKEHFLYSNKHEGEFLLPELQHLDFIWLVRDSFHDEIYFHQLQQQLRSIPGVQLVTEVAHEKIKSRDNLQR